MNGGTKAAGFAANEEDELMLVEEPIAQVSAALRLKGLSASFGAVRLMALAQEAADAPAGDSGILRKLQRAVERL